MKTEMLILLCGFPVIFYSCQKDDPAVSTQKVERLYYAYDGSVTPVEVTWSADNSLHGERTFMETGFVSFTMAPDDVLKVNVKPDSSNRFLNSYFRIQPNNESPVIHETILRINGEIMRYDYAKRKKCGEHTCEMTATLEPYL